MFFPLGRVIAEGGKGYSISLKTTLQYILRDLSRYRMTEDRSYGALFVMCPGLIAGIYYRIGHWIWYYQGHFSLLVKLLRPSYIIWKRLLEVYSGISLSPRAKIGPGLYINHFGSIFVGDVNIGENCNLSQEVTIGVAGRGDKRGMPVLGDRVYIAAGAKVFGQVVLGDDVVVGANAVVTKSFPDCSVVGGVPAQLISHQGSFDFILYRAMDYDPERLANLARSKAETRQMHP